MGLKIVNAIGSTVLSLTAIVLMIGCGRVTYTANDLFPFRLGESWDMRDQQGFVTHFEILPVRDVACHPGESIDMHMTKNDTNAYWNVGFPGAEIHWILYRDSSGAWRASASLFRDLTPQDQDGVTINYKWLNGNAYLVVPAQISKGDQLTRTGYGQWFMNMHGQTTACLWSETPVTVYRWTSKLSVANVSTPVYAGPAVINEQFEGCSSPADEMPNINKCAHEQWIFAPGIGLVEINALWEHVDLKRIN